MPTNENSTVTMTDWVEFMQSPIVLGNATGYTETLEVPWSLHDNTTDTPDPPPPSTDQRPACSLCGQMQGRGLDVWRARIWDRETNTTRERLVCSDCYHQHRWVCRVCDATLLDSPYSSSPFVRWQESELSGEIILCPDCFTTQLDECSMCGAPVLNSRTMQSSRYDSRDGCNHLGLCHKCWTELQAIKAYNYKPPEWRLRLGMNESPSTALTLGVELEADTYLDPAFDTMPRRIDAARDIYRIDDKYLFVKHDGSLEEGLETVFHPATLLVHKTFTPWAELFRTLDDNSLSPAHPTCGFHVHVGRKPYLSKHTALLKLSCFVYMHPNEMTLLGGRTLRRCQEYAKWKKLKGTAFPADAPRHLVNQDTTSWTLAACVWDRYEALNFGNADTVEFRFMQGPDSVETLLSHLEMVDAIVRFSYLSTISHILRPASVWAEFCDYLHQNYRTYKLLVMRMKQLDIWKPSKEKRK